MGVEEDRRDLGSGFQDAGLLMLLLFMFMLFMLFMLLLLSVLLITPRTLFVILIL